MAPRVNEGRHPILKGMNAHLKDGFWPFLRDLETTFTPYRKVDWDRRYKKSLPYILGGLGLFLVLMLASGGAPVIGIFLMGLFFIGVPGLLIWGIVHGLTHKGPDPKTTKDLEKKAVRHLADHLGFDWTASLPTLEGTPEWEAMIVLGLIKRDGRDLLIHLEDRLVSRASDAELSLVEAIIHGASEPRENVAAHHFRGLIVGFRLPRRIPGLIIGQGRRSGLEKMGAPTLAPTQDLEEVTLEAPAFNDAFRVFASDQVEARYLLTPTLMERLLASRTVHHPRSLDFCLVEDRFVLALDLRRESFEFGTGATLLDPEGTERVIGELVDFLELAEVLRVEARTRI